MTKKTQLLFAVILLLVVVGCSETEETATFKGKAFVGGSEGLALSFLPGQPPSEVFDTDNPFQIAVRLENRGEYDIESAGNVIVSITGVNPSNFGVSSSQLTKQSPDPLDGVRIDSSGNKISGDDVVVDFPEMNYFSEIQGSVDFTVRANACYEYGTKAQAKLCIKEDLRGTTGEAGVCNPDRIVPIENSGAPVQITNMEQNVAGSNKIDFFFTIKKVGSASDSLHKTGTVCGTEVSSRDVVYIDVEDTRLGTLTCSGLTGGTATAGYVTLYSDAREVRCTQVIDESNMIDAEVPLSIDVKYGYKQYVDTQLIVKHAS
ncbi:hypothetical protein JXB27_01410 [Candidatus Woesearchaeota archaeon]|nr:hypothetical protein [Candidatus Woesearchaeota archaeon]